MDRKNAWTTYSKEELDRLEQVNTEYKNCLDAGKTERECVTFLQLRQAYRILRPLPGINHPLLLKQQENSIQLIHSGAVGHIVHCGKPRSALHSEGEKNHC